MKIPLTRTCMGCNCKKNKNELLRIVKINNNKIEIDNTSKKDGRGAYICKDIKCLEKVIKTKRLSRVLKIDITDKQYNMIRGVIIEN